MFIQPIQGQWLWRSRTTVCLQVCSVPWHVCDHYITATSWRVCNTESCDFLSTSQEPPLGWSDHDFCHEKISCLHHTVWIMLFVAWCLDDGTAGKGVKMHLRFPYFTALIRSLDLRVFECDSVHISAFFYVTPDTSSPAPSTLQPTKAALSSLLWHHYSQHQ